MKEQIENLFKKYEDIIHQEEYTQLVIDIIQNEYMDFEDIEENGISESDFVGALIYQLDITTEVMKEGKDKVLLAKMKNDFELLKL